LRVTSEVEWLVDCAWRVTTMNNITVEMAAHQRLPLHYMRLLYNPIPMHSSV
jgi:hypothetical protein